MKSSGLDLEFPGREINRQAENDPREEGYELVERAEKFGYASVFFKKLGELYFRLDLCHEVPLLFFTFIEFSSLKQMDAAIAEGRFISLLARRMASVQEKRILSIFASQLDLLHSQAENIGMSLKFFYEEALQLVEEVYTEAPAKETVLEREEEDAQKFKEELRKRKPKEKRKIKVFRSSFKLPPSNNEATLKLT